MVTKKKKTSNKTTKTSKKSKKNIKKTIIKYAIYLTLLCTLSLSLFLGTIYIGLWGKLPTYNELENIQNSEASKIFTSDDVVIGKYYLENRTNLRYNKISQNVIDALISTEDSRFYEHNGVDKRSLLRVVFKTILLGDRSSGGGSTLSQQLSKNLFPRRRYAFASMPINKFKELITASRLEKIYSKQEILTLYLNTVPFGENTFGIASAAQRYFSKSASELNTIEAATLVGMLKAPSSYNPRIHPERSLKRRNVVLNQMVKNNLINSNLYNSLKTKPLNIKYKRLGANTGLATYLRENIRQELKTILKDKKFNPYSDGLNIYTTINSHLQEYAEESVKEYMKSLQHSFYKQWGKKDPWYKNKKAFTSAIHKSERYKRLKKEGKTKNEINKILHTKTKMEIYSPYSGDRTELMSPIDSIKHYIKLLHAGFIAINPRNGNVLAWVGGLDHKYFKYDMVKAKRQTGSVFKPIVYAAALENGESPKTYYENKKTVYKEYNDWSPRNSHEDYTGYYSMKGALANSINTVAVELIMKTGIEKTIELAHQMGIESKLPIYPSIALGVSDISLYEMTKAYCSFANNGKSPTVNYIEKITDHNGNVIYEKEEAHFEQILEERNANLISHMLQSAINEGTGRRLRFKYGLRNELAGKTGTTQNNSDGWFIGYNPQIVAGCRVGAEDMRIHFASTYYGQGANTALPIFGIFMQKTLKDPLFAHWKNIQFPSVELKDEKRLDIPMFKKGLNLFEKIEQKILPKAHKEKKRKNIFQRIKNIFRKKE